MLDSSRMCVEQTFPIGEGEQHIQRVFSCKTIILQRNWDTHSQPSSDVCQAHLHLGVVSDRQHALLDLCWQYVTLEVGSHVYSKAVQRQCHKAKHSVYNRIEDQYDLHHKITCLVCGVCCLHVTLLEQNTWAQVVLWLLCLKWHRRC